MNKENIQNVKLKCYCNRTRLEGDNKLKEEFETIDRLLSEVDKKLGIDVEILQYETRNEKELFKEHFYSQKAFLGRYAEMPEKLRAVRAYVCLHSTLALVRTQEDEEEKIIWTNFDYPSPPSTNSSLNSFLKNPERLREILGKAKEMEEGKHPKLIKDFERWAREEGGKTHLEVQLGVLIPYIDKQKWMKRELSVYSADDRMQIERITADIIWHRRNKETWVIEVKPKLNPEAIGQAIVYKELYQKVFSQKVKSAIVCEEANPALKKIAKEHVDKIWIKYLHLDPLNKKETVCFREEL